MHCPTLNELPPPPPGKTGWPWTEQTEPLPKHMPDGSEWPRLSIVTPNYNYGQFLEETIRSVLLQGYPNLEYIIIDGGSTDNSSEIIKKYEKWLNYWVSEKDSGQSDAINKGFDRATGEIYAWLNSDDVFCQGSLLEVGLFWLINSKFHLLTGDGQFFSVTEEGREELEYYVKAESYSFKELLKYYEHKYLPQPSVFFSKEVFRKLGGLNIALSYAMDIDLWIRIRKEYAFHYLPKCLSKLRHHQDAKTWRDNVLLVREVNSLIQQNLEQIGILGRLYSRIKLAYFYAFTLSRRGLAEYLNGNRFEAIEWSKKAILCCPPIIFSSISLKLIMRLILPNSIKKILFSTP